MVKQASNLSGGTTSITEWRSVVVLVMSTSLKMKTTCTLLHNSSRDYVFIMKLMDGSTSNSGVGESLRSHLEITRWILPFLPIMW